jgi:hypothetical protein
MPSFINGAPTHILIVHVVAVLLPVAVLAALVLVLVPVARRAFGLLSVAVAFVACLAVPLAFASGGDLRDRLAPTALISHHVDAAHQLLPVAAVFGVALAGFVAIDIAVRATEGQLNRFESVAVPRVSRGKGLSSSRNLSGQRRGVAVLLVVASVTTAGAVVRAGDSGAKAAWDGRVAAQSRDR